MRAARRWIIVAAVLAVLLGAYAAIGYLAVPGWITTAARDAVRKSLGRELEVGRVHFSPFTLGIEIDDLRLPDADGGDLLRWHRFTVDFDALASLWRRGYVLRNVELDGPGVRVVLRPDGRWNVQDLVPARPAQPAPKAPAGIPRVWVDRLAVTAGQGVLVDRSRPVEHVEKLTPVEFTLTGFSTIATSDHYELRASSPDLGSIEWHGSVEVEPVRSSGDFRFAEVNLARVAAWIEDRIPFDVSTGTLAVAGHYDLALDGASAKVDAKISSVEVASLGLRARGDSQDAVSVPRIAATDVHFEFPGPHVSVGRVALEGARVPVALDSAMQPSLTRLIAARPAAAPFLSFTLAPIDASVTGVTWPLAAPVHLEAAVTIDGGGRVTAAGSVDVDAQSVDLDVEATAIALQPVQPLLSRTTSLILKSGVVGARGKVRYSPQAGAHFAGDLSCGTFRVTDQVVREDLVRWKSVELAGVEASQKPLSVSVREIDVRQPYARLIIAPDGTTNVADALAPPGSRPVPTLTASATGSAPAGGPAAAPAAAPGPAAAAPAAKSAAARDKGRKRVPPAAPPAPPAAALPVEIRLVRIIDGALNYADYTLTPKFATGILDLNGTIKGLSGKADARADVHIDGKVDRYAPVEIRGTINYFAAQSYTDIGMSFHNIELTTFSPYSGKFAGYRIDRGKLSIDTHYKIENRKLEATHHVVINQLQLGDKVESRDAVSLPLKLAVALLKDRNGVIDLDLPVTGSLDDPQFRLGPIIWKVVKNLLVKIVTSPFALLGSLFGGGPDLQYVDFAPGSAVLDPPEASKLGGLHKALVSRPAVNLEIPLVEVPGDDRPALAQARWSELLAQAAAARYGAPGRDPAFLGQLRAKPADYRRFLEGLYAARLGHKPEPPKPEPAASGQPAPDRTASDVAWLEGEIRRTTEPSQDDLVALAKARADSVQEAVLAGGDVDPSRIFVIAAHEKPAEPPAEAPSGRVRVQLSLQ